MSIAALALTLQYTSGFMMTAMSHRLTVVLGLLAAACANSGHAAQEGHASSSPAADPSPSPSRAVLIVTGMR